MQISVPVSDYIPASLLTTELDRIIRGAAAPERLLPSMIPFDGGYLNFAELAIVDWDMDTDETHLQAHGLTMTDIIFCFVMIHNDANSQRAPIYVDYNNVGHSDASWFIMGDNIYFSRVTGGGFDQAAYGTSPGSRGSALFVYKS